MTAIPILENAELQTEMLARMKVTLDNDTDYADFGNAGLIETYGRNIEDNANWVNLTEDQQWLWKAFRRKHDLSTNPEDFWKAVAALKTYLEGVANPV